jgi:hypothetical protein
MAIKYLKKHHNKVAVVDYKLKNAVALCDELAFQDIINARIAECNGEIPVRIVGQRAGKWNGVDEMDSSGRYIRWYRKPGFTFTRPDLVDFEICAKPTVVVSDV